MCFPATHPTSFSSHTPQADLTKEWEGGKQTSQWWCRERERRGGAGQRCGDGGEMNLKMLCLQIKTVQCVFAGVAEWKCVLFVGPCVRICICICVCVCVYGWSCIQCMCVGVCVQQTQLWLALQLITRYSQLLITQHLFCPRSALFCAYYQPGSLRRISRRALSNTPRLKCWFFFFFFPPLGCCAAEDTSAYVSSKLRDPANGQASESNGARSFPWSLSGAEACLLSLMTLWQSRADQFRSTSCLEAPQCVF